ncbi:hypothetical protein ACLBR5_07950 [Escherichia coli]
MPGWISLLTPANPYLGHHRLYHGNVGGEPVSLELSHMQLYIGAALSAILVLFTLTLPHIPVAKQQANQSWTTLLGLDAFALFKNKRMAIFLSLLNAAGRGTADYQHVR